MKHSFQLSRTILIVEDDPTLQSLIREGLEDHGYRSVMTANSGVEAVSLLDSYEEEIAVVVLDLMMPKMGGLDLMRHLVNVHHTPVAIIVETGHSECMSKEEFFSLGTEIVLASEYITKPFDVQLLLGEVEKAFTCVDRKRKAQQREAEARLHARLERIESTLKTIESNQRGMLTELGLDLVKAVIIALALLALLYFGVDDFVRKVIPNR